MVDMSSTAFLTEKDAIMKVFEQTGIRPGILKGSSDIIRLFKKPNEFIQEITIDELITRLQEKNLVILNSNGYLRIIKK